MSSTCVPCHPVLLLASVLVLLDSLSRQIDGYGRYVLQKYAGGTKNGRKFGNTYAKVARQAAEVMHKFIQDVCPALINRHYPLILLFGFSMRTAKPSMIPSAFHKQVDSSWNKYSS